MPKVKRPKTLHKPPDTGLLGAIQSLRRWQHDSLLKDFSAGGGIRMQSQELSRHLDIVLKAALLTVDVEAER